ncbi:hypothetical protein D3C87_106380 [compost metagenome]
MTYFKSEKPISYYLLLAILVFTIVLFSVFAVIGRLDITSSIISIIGINLFTFYFIGRYLCILRLFEDRISLTYIYPFKIEREYNFNGISEIDGRGNYDYHSSQLDGGLGRTFYRCFYNLYLTDNDGKLLNIKYNISEKENREFIVLLQKLIAKKKY